MRWTIKCWRDVQSRIGIVLKISTADELLQTNAKLQGRLQMVQISSDGGPLVIFEFKLVNCKLRAPVTSIPCSVECLEHADVESCLAPRGVDGPSAATVGDESMRPAIEASACTQAYSIQSHNNDLTRPSSVQARHRRLNTTQTPYPDPSPKN